MKLDINCIIANRPHNVTDAAVVNLVNIENDNKMVMSNIRLDVEMERKHLMNNVDDEISKSN